MDLIGTFFFEPCIISNPFYVNMLEKKKKISGLYSALQKLQQINRLKYVDLTHRLDGLGLRICLINNFAPGESQGGKENSAAFYL
jgi:hypothetical protein